MVWSGTDFDGLRSRLKESKHKNIDLEVLKAAIRAQLEKLIRLNKTRADFVDKFEALIESYNADSRNIEELFEELVKLTRSLSEEQQRHVRELMTEEELVIFDILTRPAPELNEDERAEVKKVARVLLERMKQLLVLDWRQRAALRSQLKLTIEDTLDTGLPQRDRRVKETRRNCAWLSTSKAGRMGPLRATSPFGIRDGADCWLALNSRSCRSWCHTQSDLPPAWPDWRVGPVP